MAVSPKHFAQKVVFCLTEQRFHMQNMFCYIGLPSGLKGSVSMANGLRAWKGSGKGPGQWSLICSKANLETFCGLYPGNVFKIAPTHSDKAHGCVN